MLAIFNVASAVIAAAAYSWVMGAVSWRWTTGRPVSGLLLLTVGILTLKTAFTLATGNTFIYFAQPVLVDITLATIFLGSLWSATPVIARLAPDFYPMDAVVTTRSEVHAHFRRLTLMWGLVILLKAGITLWLLVTLSTVHFVLIKGSGIITLTHGCRHRHRRLVGRSASAAKPASSPGPERRCRARPPAPARPGYVMGLPTLWRQRVLGLAD